MKLLVHILFLAYGLAGWAAMAFREFQAGAFCMAAAVVLVSAERIATAIEGKS